MNYRNALPEDLPAIRQLISDSDVEWEITEQSIQTAVVCASGRLIVGMATMEIVSHTALGHYLLVHPGFRGMGIGRKISQFLFEQARGLGMQRVCFWSEDAEFFFRAQGLHPCSEDHESWLYSREKITPLKKAGRLLELELPVVQTRLRAAV